MAFDLDEQELKATREKSADELFGKLGYKKELENDECLIYESRMGSIGNYISKIYFWKYTGTIEFRKKQIILKELQAINKKCKELGWL